MPTYRFEYAVFGPRRRLFWFEKTIKAADESAARKKFRELRGYHSHAYCADGCEAGPFISKSA